MSCKLEFGWSSGKCLVVTEVDNVGPYCLYFCFVALFKFETKPNVSAKCAPELAGYGIPLSKYCILRRSENCKSYRFYFIYSRSPLPCLSLSLSAILLNIRYPYKQKKSTGIMTIYRVNISGEWLCHIIVTEERFCPDSAFHPHLLRFNCVFAMHAMIGT